MLMSTLLDRLKNTIFMIFYLPFSYCIACHSRFVTMFYETKQNHNTRSQQHFRPTTTKNGKSIYSHWFGLHCNVFLYVDASCGRVCFDHILCGVCGGYQVCMTMRRRSSQVLRCMREKSP